MVSVVILALVDGRGGLGILYKGLVKVLLWLWFFQTKAVRNDGKAICILTLQFSKS